MMYQKDKLATEIARYLDVNACSVISVLNELGYEPQELNREDIMKWTTKVENEIFF